MKDLKKHIKFKINKSSNDINMPQYTISYMLKDIYADTRELSSTIISALKGDSDIILEVNSAIFSLSPSERNKTALKFLDDIRGLELDYLYRKTPSQSKSLFSFVFGKKDEYAHEILVYIPHEIWKSENLYNIIPAFGVRYFITKDNSSGRKALDDMYQLLDEEKLDKFKLIIFDVASFSQMGIVSNSISAEDIKQLLCI